MVEHNNFLTGGFSDADAAIAALAEEVFYHDGREPMSDTFNAGSQSLFAIEDSAYNHIAVGPTPAAGKLALYAKADDELYIKTSGGAETILSGGLVGPGVAVDNALCRFDTTTGQLIQSSLGILTDVGELSGLTALDVIHTALIDDDHSIDVRCDADGFGGVRTVNLVYESGAITSTESGSVILSNINETNSASGSSVFGHTVLSTTSGSASIHALVTGTNVNPILQQSGLFVDADSITELVAGDVTVALSGGGGGSIATFTNDDDTLIIGDAAEFAEIEIILGTDSSGGGILPLFEYSTGAGPAWATFSPVDGTNGMRNSGVIFWQLSDIPLWAVEGTPEFLIRITRTRNTLTTTPVLDLVQIAGTLICGWSKEGIITINSTTITENADANTWYGFGALDSYAVSSGLNNTAYGHNTLTAVTTGDNCTAVGANALITISTNSDCTAVGSNALNLNTAAQITAVGSQALAVNTGARNNAFGYKSLTANTVGFNNNSFGHESLLANVSGDNNTGFGHNTLKAATVDELTAFGSAAMITNVTGLRLTAVGFGALNAAANTGDNDCTAVGHSVLTVNLGGQQNTGLGSQALLINTTGNDCTAIGYNTLSSNITASGITAVGSGALAANNAAQNTAVGYQSLTANTGLNNTAVGWRTSAVQVAVNNNAAFGYLTMQGNTASEITGMGTLSLTVNTGLRNAGLGYKSLSLNEGGNDNTAGGHEALMTNVTGSDCAAFGRGSLRVSLGNQNTAFGSQSGLLLTSGTDNTLLGYNAGSALTTSDSDNIMINNIGVVGDNAIIKIGSATQTSCFLAGVGSVTPGGTPEVVTMDPTTGEMGTSDIAADLVTSTAASTDNAVARFDSTTGNIIQNSMVTIDDSGQISGVVTLDITHTATEDDDHAIEIDIDAAAFGDVKAMLIEYTTGAIAAGEDEEAILINVDQTAAAGGRVVGLEVIGTTGSAEIDALEVGVGVHPIRQQSGTFIDADVLLNIAVDETVALSGGGGGGVTTFVLDNDTFTVQDAAVFSEMEWILDTPASAAGIQALFEFSDGSGPTTWAAFAPVDGTNQMRSSGVILWDIADIPTWVVGDSGNFEIRITRQRNTLGTTPIVDLIQISATNIFTWDENGDVVINSLTATGAVDLTPCTSLTVSASDDTATALQLIASGGTTSQVTLQNSTGTGTSSILIDSVSGSLNIDSGVQTTIDAGTGIFITAATERIDCQATNSVELNSIELQSILGGVQIAAGIADAQAVQLKAIHANSGMEIAAGTLGIDISTTGQTTIAGATLTGGAITTTDILAASESGTTFSVAQTSSYAITLPTAAAGLNYRFVVITAGAFTVTIATAAAANHLYGTIVNDITSVLPVSANNTFTLVSGTAAVGDSIEVWGIDATHWYATAKTSANGGITIA